MVVACRCSLAGHRLFNQGLDETHFKTQWLVLQVSAHSTPGSSDPQRQPRRAASPQKGTHHLVARISALVLQTTQTGINRSYTAT
jgi:hypothetical protein